MTFDRRRLLQLGGAAGLGLTAAGGASLVSRRVWAADPPFPAEILDPIEVYGAAAQPVIGKLPGAQRMYLLPNGQGEHHRIGSMVMTRIARPLETADGYELASFAGPAGSVMPRHAHVFSHSAFLVTGGDVELELDGKVWRMLKGDFANIPPGVSHGWTMRSDRGKVVLFSMGDRVGRAFAAMGAPATSATPPTAPAPVAPGKLALASFAGDLQPRAPLEAPPAPVRVSNLVRPAGPGAYVLLDGGGERYGGNTFCAKNDNTGGQFLFIMTEGGPSPGIGAHFHARHTEDFFGLDGETSCWAYGKAVPLREGDFLQAPPRHMHGFKTRLAYNRFVGFLTPGIFENFFTGGRAGSNGVGGRGAGEGSVPAPGGGGGRGGPPGGGAAGGGRGAPTGAPPGTPPQAAPGAATVDRFRQLSMSNRGPDGYPLDVHGPTRPLPPQDPIWTSALDAPQDQRLALLQHANTLCGGGILGEVPLSAELKRALALKPRAELFI